MLILARKAGEAISIGDQITIRILEMKNGQVKIGVEAPATVAVHRQEIYRRIVEENIKAATGAPVDLPALPAMLAESKLLVKQEQSSK